MQVSRFLFSPLASLLRRKHLVAACTVAVLCAVAAGRAQAQSMVITHAPVSSFGSGGNAGLIQVAEESATGAIVTSANNIKLTVANGTNGTLGSSVVFTTGSTTNGITPTYAGGIATFDLSTLPLYATSNATYSLTFVDTGSGSITTATSISVGAVSNLYIVTSYTDITTPVASNTNCTNWYASTSTPGTLDTSCSLRQALVNVSAAQGSCTVTSGAVVNTCSISSVGGYYSSVPAVSVVGTAGSGATATATLSGGTTGYVTGFTVTAGGSGYTGTSATMQVGPPSITAATIAFNNTSAQTITLTSSLAANITWYAPLTIAGTGVNNLVISGAVSGTPTYQIFKEHSQSPAGTIGTFNLTGITLASGYVASDAGAAYLYGSANLWNVYFYKNSGTASGGAVYYPSTATTAWTATMNYCVFDSNSDTSNAGAFGDGATNGSVVINNSFFFNNSSSANGGAINFSGTIGSGNTVAVNIANSTFLSNTASSYGGAINAGFNSSSAGASSLTLTNDTFYGNTSTGGAYGGAIYGTASTAYKLAVTMTDVTIVGNQVSVASGKGGGYYGASASTTTVNNSLVEGNQANGTSGTYPDLYPNTSTVNTSLVNVASTQTPTYAYPGLAALGLSDPGLYGGAQVSIWTGAGTGSVYATYAQALMSPPTIVPLPVNNLILKVGSGSNQSSMATDERGVVRPTTGSTNIDVGAVQTLPTLLFTADAAPANTTTSTTFSPAPVVAYEDDGYILTNTHTALPIVLSISSGTLSGTTSYSPNTTTVATFSGVADTTAGSGVHLTATAGSGTGQKTASTSTFNVVGAASQVIYTTTPTTPLQAGSSSASVVAAIEDSAGNVETTNSSSTVMLAISCFSGCTSYTGYTTSVMVNNGVATFAGLPVLTIPGVYTYTASSSGITSATANETVNANATSLTLAASPSTAVEGSPFTLTATLSPYTAGSASTDGETVTFLNNGTAVGTGTLSGGVATLTTGGLSLGTDTITASYAGDGAFTAATASGMAVSTTPPAYSALTPGMSSVTVTLNFTTSFTLGSRVVTSFPAGTPFSITSSTCVVGNPYSASSGCTVTVGYAASGAGLLTGTVEVLDNESTPQVQAATNVIATRYR